MSRFTKIERNFTVTKSLDDEGYFEGYASVFDIEDHHGETVAKGAFKRGLQKLAKEKRHVKMLWSHDRDQPIGVFKEADEDTTGLYVRGKLTRGVQKADETRLLMLDEAVDSMSIGAYVIKDVIDHKAMTRKFTELELREISPCVFPALDAARVVSVKSILDIGDIAELEAYLRDVCGLSLKQAKTVISKAKSCTPRRDVGDGTVEMLRTAINNLKG